MPLAPLLNTLLNSIAQVSELPVILLTGASIISLMDWFYHFDRLKKLKANGPFKSLSEGKFIVKKIRLGSKSFDDIIGPLVFLKTWMIIVSIWMITATLNTTLVWLIAPFLVAGQFRSLQEIGHFGMHGTLTKNKRWGIFLSNIFCQYPLLLTSGTTRKNNHCVLHHPNANKKGRDPNLDDFIRIGLIPGISQTKFWIGFFHPLTVKGIQERVLAAWTHMKDQPVQRISCILLICAPFIWFEKAHVIFVLYVFPVFIIYPLFSWISQVVEHRWFLEIHDKNLSRQDRELVYGRRTVYPGISGRAIKTLIFPYGDSFHLTHSLFPYVRYNYLKTLDQLLENTKGYSEDASYGFLRRLSTSNHSAISEFKLRLTSNSSSQATKFVVGSTDKLNRKA